MERYSVPHKTSLGLEPREGCRVKFLKPKRCSQDTAAGTIAIA